MIWSNSLSEGSKQVKTEQRYRRSPITDLVSYLVEPALPEHHSRPEGPLPRVTSAILQVQTCLQLQVITSSQAQQTAKPRCRVFCKRKPSTSQSLSTSWLCAPSFLGLAFSALLAVLCCLSHSQTRTNRTLLWPLLATELVSQSQVQHSDLAICKRDSALA